jgi:hypothetical protein
MSDEKMVVERRGKDAEIGRISDDGQLALLSVIRAEGARSPYIGLEKRYESVCIKKLRPAAGDMRASQMDREMGKKG